MKTQILIMIFLSCLLATGCTRFIVPEIGAIAQEESRIPYKAGEKLDGILDTKDITFEYTLSESDNGVRLTGELVFDRSLTDSFPMVKTFFLKMNWLDVDGLVLQTIDITPLYSYLSVVPNKMGMSKQIETVPGSRFINFNYYGVFRGEKPDVSEEWDIFLFPFSTP
jgi:hypothetical protein